MFFASPFWALLPTVAHQLRESATLYGLLLTVFGGGAMLGALALTTSAVIFSVDAVLAMGTTVFAAVYWPRRRSGSIALLCIVIAFGGAAWTIVMSLMSTVMQNVAPDWVRARAAAIFMLVYMGAWAAGSAFWAMWRGTEARTFLPGSGDWHSVSPVLILNFAPAEHSGGPWGVGPLA